MLAGAITPTFIELVRGIVYTQCLNSEATIACALECYRIEHQAYPETIAELVAPGEKPLPLDAISGQAIKYRKISDDRYTLWCVGFDEKDDGGERRMDKKHPWDAHFNRTSYRGDWVWDFPE